MKCACVWLCSFLSFHLASCVFSPFILRVIVFAHLFLNYFSNHFIIRNSFVWLIQIFAAKRMRGQAGKRKNEATKRTQSHWWLKILFRRDSVLCLFFPPSIFWVCVETDELDLLCSACVISSFFILQMTRNKQTFKSDEETRAKIFRILSFALSPFLSCHGMKTIIWLIIICTFEEVFNDVEKTHGENN